MPKRSDAGLILLAAALGGLFFWDLLSTEDPGAARIGFDLAVGALACAALLLRRRWPIGVAVTLIPVILLSSSAMGATAVAMSAVALYRSRRTAATLVLVHAGLLLGIFTLADGELVWDGLIALIALDATMVASGWLVRSERRFQLAAQERERAEAGKRLEEARNAERERIARELHDVLAHRLSLLAVYAGALGVRKSAPPEEREAAEVIRQGAFAALEELRQVIWVARDPSAAELDSPQPTLADLPALLEESRRAGTCVSVEGELGVVSDNIGRHLYRVIQEGLTNARKHAPGETVHLRLSANGGVEVELSNALAEGAAAVPGAGAGLAGLRERMTLLGGRLSFGGTPNGRFRLHAWIPSQS
ncbi:MAG TPA: histidine kinase [Candidatus Limnocylindrales bacterium]|nr:histidine kinase [Candidatus Limnocylindrales bacterium]